MNHQSLFLDLLRASTETDVDAVLRKYALADRTDAWTAYGDTTSNYAVVENQQSHPVPALVEKVTNGIDAILERRCLEEGIDPRSPEAPRSVEDAIVRFFPGQGDWDLAAARNKQAREVQIVADGPRNDTSLMIYDNGVGQAPEHFPTTFLSLLRGNKNDVHFVQGKYNMGGAGAIAFCGERRYQLIASKHYTNTHPLGFTLLRRHPLSLEESQFRKATWYEYLVFDGKVASFDSDPIDVGLEGRRFETGSLLKLYSYRLPEGVRSIISRDLNLSLNEFLFEPALPFLTVDNNERYPKNKAPVTPVFGLKRRLEADRESLETHFSQTSETADFGHLSVTTYVFKAKARGEGVKGTKAYIRREYFKNNMTVLFSLNGQVQGSYTSEFVTRSLQLQLLKDYLLIHVDCSGLNTEVRNELFMASRDRLKSGETADALRRHLRTLLAESDLKDIAKRRRASLSVEASDAGQLLRDVTKNMPMSEALTRLLKQTFELPDMRPGSAQQKSAHRNKPKRLDKDTETIPFKPQRYPSAFALRGGEGLEGNLTLFKLPMNGKRVIQFSTDVEDDYFDRSEDPGTLKISPLRPGSEARGGNGSAEPTELSENLDIMRTSPANGTIRIGLRASQKAEVGETVKIKASLSSPTGNLEQTFLVKITDPEKQIQPPSPEPIPKLGLPELVLCDEQGSEGRKSFEEIEASGIDMDYNTVVKPVVEEERLAQIIINLNSTTFQNFRSRLKSADAIEIAERRYISAVFFHTLFLFTTTKSRSYELRRQESEGNASDVEIEDYITDVFGSAYAQFLLNFDTSELLETIA